MHNEQRRIGEFNTHRAQQRQEKENSKKPTLRILSKLMEEKVHQRLRKVIKEQVLLRPTNDKKLWRTMILHILNEHGKQRKYYLQCISVEKSQELFQLFKQLLE